MFLVLYAFALLFPFLQYPTGQGNTATDPKTIWLITFTCVLWLIFLFRWLRNSQRDQLRLAPVDWVLIAYVALITLSTLLSVDPLQSLLGEFRRNEGLSSLLAYCSMFVFTAYALNDKQRYQILQAVAVSGFVVAIYGILQHYKLDFLPRPYNVHNSIASYGFFDNQNFYGSYIVLVLLITIGLFLAARKWNGQVFYLIAVAMMFVSLLFSMTRGAWIGVLVGFLVIGCFTITIRRDLMVRYLAIAAVFALLFIAVNGLEKNRYSARSDTIIRDASKAVTSPADNGRLGSGRWYIWQKSLPLVPLYAWHGSGPDTFRIVFPQHLAEMKQGGMNPSILIDKAHNDYLQIAITLGIPALLVYLSFIALVLRGHIFTIRRLTISTQLKEAEPLQASIKLHDLKSHQTDNQIHTLKPYQISNLGTQALLIGLLAAIIGYGIQAFFNISVVTVAPYFWLLMGIGYGWWREGGRSDAK